MKIIKPSYKILTKISEYGQDELKAIEYAARTCYKSEDKMTDDSTYKLVKNIIANGHEAMLEHSQLSVKFICDRAIANEIVRHRLFSFAQESTRYCNYGQEKFGGEITVIEPPFFMNGSIAWATWVHGMEEAERTYFNLLNIGYSPEEARLALPLCTKTELVVTGNYREWRNFFKLRCDSHAHVQMRELACQLILDLRLRIPLIFDDINVAGMA